METQKFKCVFYYKISKVSEFEDFLPKALPKTHTICGFLPKFFIMINH